MSIAGAGGKPNHPLLENPPLEKVEPNPLLRKVEQKATASVVTGKTKRQFLHRKGFKYIRNFITCKRDMKFDWKRALSEAIRGA